MDSITAPMTETLNWIRRSQAGDGEAFAELFNHYKNLVFKTACLMLGSAIEAEDMLQEVFLEVHRSLSSYEPSKGAFTTWLYRITVNDCLNWRRKRRPKLIPLELLPVRMTSILSHEDQMSADDAVWQALRKLNPKLRTVVVLRYYGDLSYAEITEILNIPLGTVKSRLNRALLELHDALDLRADDMCAPAMHPEALDGRVAG
ncbi:MAG: sigma-70 family RNA polymerase sigma factor [Chloroflexi bacterium]|nr:sigma-70 family RNA polymerase sigma factor [Chloroflexota bacterium]